MDEVENKVGEVAGETPKEPATPSETGDIITEEKPPIPYTRFEEVVRQNQQYREELANKVAALEEVVAKKEVNTSAKKSWNDVARTADSWDTFVGELKKDILTEFETKSQEKERQAEEQLNKEIKSLYDKGFATNESDVNAAIKFALEKQKELGMSIPLAVAAKWLNESKPKSTEKEDVAKKIQSSSKSAGIESKAPSYKDTKSKSLDDIVYEAKQNVPR